MNLHWRPAGHITKRTLPPALRDLLLDTGSLTQHLITHCPGKFRLELSGQAWQRPLPHEAMALDLYPGVYALVREIYLKCDDIPWVYGRSIIPEKTLTGTERRLVDWGQRSLGDYLFSEGKARRGMIEITKIPAENRLFHLAKKNTASDDQELWGRRSMFYIKNKPLLVMEIFFSDIVKCMNSGKK